MILAFAHRKTLSLEDSKAIAAIKPVFRELQLPTIQDLQDRRGFL